MKKIFSPVAILFTGILFACSASLYVPSPTTVKDPSANIGELAAGREIYKNHCGACHGLHKPKQYSEEKWKTILDKMQPKAKIDNEQRRLIYSYLINQK